MFDLTTLRSNWALVSGASSGIGVEYCRQLAELGANLVMVARRLDRMEGLANSLRQSYGVKTLVVGADLSEGGAARRVRLDLEASRIRVRLLVNNAAFGPWGRFESIDTSVHERVVQLVAGAPVAFCREFYEQLCSFAGSAIVNVSSQAAYQPVPYKAAYSAAKACLHNFSLALYEEWKAKGIHVQTLVPGPTESELDEKGGAYPCELPGFRASPVPLVRKSIAMLERDIPVVTSANGLYKLRLFNGLFPYRTIVRTVGRMFHPPGK